MIKVGDITFLSPTWAPWPSHKPYTPRSVNCLGSRVSILRLPIKASEQFMKKRLPPHLHTISALHLLTTSFDLASTPQPDRGKLESHTFQ